jgi:hypothetical protein
VGENLVADFASCIAQVGLEVIDAPCVRYVRIVAHSAHKAPIALLTHGARHYSDHHIVSPENVIEVKNNNNFCGEHIIC